MLLAFPLLAIAAYAAQPAGSPPTQAQAKQTMDDGNFKEALEAYTARLKSPNTPSKEVQKDLHLAVECLRRLNRYAEFDTLVEATIEAHPHQWRVLWSAGNQYLDAQHFGYLISGEFQRGQHRGGGKVVNSEQRDRVRSLQLLRKALTLADADPQAPDDQKTQLCSRLADAVMYGRKHQNSWELQLLSDLEMLPDYEEGWQRGGTQAAPVTADNKPVYYELPASWEAAKNDGERWRWSLAHMVEIDSATKWLELTTRADFLHGQFGVVTLRGAIAPLLARGERDGLEQQASIYSLHTLKENETIARLATGIQRFELPDDQNFILLYKQALQVANQSESKGRAHSTATTLAHWFADRRQFPRSAEYWRQALEYAEDKDTQERDQQMLDQIEKPWGQFETAKLQPAGKGATFEFRYRNGKSVEFTAQAIKVAELLADLKAYLKSNPRELDWQKLDISRIGYRLVNEKQEEYVGEEVAKWTVELEPRDGHFDSHTTITSPLQKAGAYLVTARLADGNTTNIVLWVADTAIVKKNLSSDTMYYVADAATGKPIAKANLEMFGYKFERSKPNEMRVDTQQFAELTDADGLAIAPVKDGDDNRRYNWLATATTPEGRLAFLGFYNVWRANPQSNELDRVHAFAITDRPVYRPGQKVQYKIWVERAKYDSPMESEYAHKTFQLEVYDPKGEKIDSKQVTANAFGGVAGELELPAGATLGQYHLQLVNYGGGSFRVEEYKKPEYEVIVDAPEEPLALGDAFEAVVSARYYFGEPVREGTIKYTVTRTNRNQQWFPVGPWDWLYGRGYWWFGYDYTWYPGWNRWGCWAPHPWWRERAQQPPEVVAEGESPLDAEGKLKIEIDTQLAKELHPDQDHEYNIEAQVVDRSRRTIVGTGDVLVARKPFDVYVWTDRGYYRTGETIKANFQAHRPDGKPVAGNGVVRLLQIAYDASGKPTETEVRKWELATSDEGTAELQIKASEPGQYRLSYKVISGEKTIEGAYLLTIVGPNFDGSDFHFADLELVPNQRHYEPGEKLQLQINANRRGSVVLLFVRPENGTYYKPQIVRLTGKSTIVPIDIHPGDMPNFFVEAQTVSNGQVHTVAKQIVVPPAKRIVNVEVAPSSPAYQPGQDAQVKIRLTDEAGQPVVGDTVLTVYDEALEYISGGSNVGDIRKAFWGWKRHHHPRTEDNLSRYTQGITPPGQIAMQQLGRFGDLTLGASTAGNEMAGLGGSRGLVTLSRSDAAPMAAPPMAMEAAADKSVDAFVDEDRSQMDSPAQGQPSESGVTPTVRKEFADTAYWAASVETDSSGLAEVTFPMPENLSKWKFGVWSMGHGTRVGDGSASAVTRKNLLVRLQTPRFLVERDEVVISANVHNYLPSDKRVKVRLELDGDYLSASRNLEMQIEVPAGGEQRVDWRLKAEHEGTAVLRALAITDEESDAMQVEIPIKVHGIEKLIPHSGVLASGAAKQAFEIVVPEQRRVGDTRLEVQFSPTLAGAMVDALPYLINYPYGCTEQTLNRFLPAVITQQTLRQMGVDLKAIREKQTNLNPQELGDAGERAEQWKRYKANPVFDEAELDKVVKAGVNRLTEMQLSDGGWGWFSGFGEYSSAHTTCTVVRGLLVARQNDVALVPGTLEKGIQWLVNYQEGELAKLANADQDGNRLDDAKPYKAHADNLDALVFLVLTDARRADVGQATDAAMAKMRGYLYKDRLKLAVYSQATFGLALQYEVDMNIDGADTMRNMLVRNLSQYVVIDDENQTAYLNLPAGFWWYWYGSEYEAHAFYLKLLVATDPKSDVAAGLVKYLLNNRKHATYWNSTRDTALVVEAMGDYLNATGEGKSEMTVEVWLNGQRQKTVEITPEVLFSFDNRFVVEGGDIEAGRHTLEIRKTGEGRLYYNAYLSLFSLEDDIKAAGLELKVARKYFKLTPVDATANVAGGRGQAVSQKVEKYERTEIPNLGVVDSGDLVEIELTVESKNDYEYVILEDLKAAGFEPVEVRSGYNGNELGAYMELRDDCVSLFVRQLARGTHSVSYRMRAETPGKFSALPTKAYAMYAPELKGNSNELKVRVVDKEQE
ncbi:MG2 domain-containing protein [Aeoliella sp. ICT_H6.2]|uniref:MG2 domain-containing protein n=1 Tax=Aeoliella straminimaris TaxID=2954799 RepID=A0A9X2JIZ4_9BACT|nr:MG2 domain-containing protein [Aeoliella straminimaris]